MKLLISALWMVLVTTAQTQAQDNAWLQIDAQPTEAEAEESARYYESFLPDVAGFALASGWYVIALLLHVAVEKLCDSALTAHTDLNLDGFRHGDRKVL